MVLCDREDYRVHLTFSRVYMNFERDEKISIRIQNRTAVFLGHRMLHDLISCVLVV